MGVGYVRPDQGATLLKLDEDHTCLTGRIYLMGDQICPPRPGYHGSGTRLEDRTCPAGQIYPTGVRYVRRSLTDTILEPDSGSDMSNVSDMSDLGSDISDLEPVPRLWNLMEISDLIGYVRSNRKESEMKDLEI
jgi:hypothetical protein